MIEFTTVVGVDAEHLREWRLTWPTWVRHRPELLARPLLAVCDADRPAAAWERQLAFLGHPRLTVVAWEQPGVPQREKMLTGLTLVPAARVHTPWFLKLDTDVVATAPGDWAPDHWFAPDGDGREPVFVAPPWGFTKSAEWIRRLDAWGDAAPAARGRPRPDLAVPPGAGRVYHARISSWCFFGRPAWLREVTAACEGRLPVPSHDTFLWYCAARRGDYYRRVPMRRAGWSHFKGFRRLRAVSSAVLGGSAGGGPGFPPAGPPHAARLIQLLGHTVAPAAQARGAEVGVDTGVTSAALLRAFPGLRLFMVDPWCPVPDGHPYRVSGDGRASQPAGRFAAARRRAEERTAFAEGRRVVLPAASPAAAAHVPDGSLDFAFVDADHTYPAVRADVRAWWPKVRAGGLLAGHDYGHPRDRRGAWGVRRAVDEWAAEIARPVGVCPETRVWWVRKPAGPLGGNRRVYYLLTGAGHGARLVTSLWSLRRFHAGPVTVYTTQPASHLIGERCAADPTLQADHRTMPHPSIPRNSSLLAKVVLTRVVPEPIGVFLDADTLVTGDITPLFDALEETPFVATQFRDWTSDAGPVRSRLDGWHRLLPRHPEPDYLAGLIAAATRPRPALNVGVFGWRRGAAVLEEWEALTRFGYRTFIPDEISLQLLLHRFPHRVLDARFNCSPAGEPKGDVRVWHFHGGRHLRGGRRVWLPAFRTCLADNPAGLADWADLVEPGLAPEAAMHQSRLDRQ